MGIVKINNNNFAEEVLNSDKPVFVDFFATWCMPCKMVGTSVEKLAAEHPEIKVCKLDIDENNELAAQYRVMSVPTFGLFKAGELIDTAVGAVSYEELLAFATK